MNSRNRGVCFLRKCKALEDQTMSKIESLAAVIAEQKTRIDAQSRVITELRAANRIISEESTELMAENGKLRKAIDKVLFVGSAGRVDMQAMFDREMGA